MISAEQLRAARAMLRWEQSSVAREANVSVETIKRLEKLTGPLNAARRATIDVIKRAFEKNGIEFLAPEEGVFGSGVRFTWEAEFALNANGVDFSDDQDHSGEVKARDQETADYWASRPEKWAALSEISRRVLSQELFGDAYTADEVFGCKP
jgi:hypothetical protein